MDGDLYALLHARRSQLLCNSTMQRFGNTHSTMPTTQILYRVPPHISAPASFSGQTNCILTTQQHSEPLDLSKSATPSQLCTRQAGSKLEQILSGSSTGTSSRKRPYSCLSTEEKQARPTTASPTGVISMDEAPDNPVIMVELSPDSAMATSEKFSCSLVRMMSKVFTISQFSRFSEQDKVALLHNSWHRLMLWSLANDALTFTVSPLKSQPAATLSISPSCRRHPTMAFVRGISVFMKKFAGLNISIEEFSLLFSITLFHSGKPSLSTQSIEENRRDLMRQLKSLVSAKSSDPKRYTDLLLCLPLLYSVDENMFENLFCSKEFGNGDVKLLLKDAIRQVTRKTCSS